MVLPAPFLLTMTANFQNSKGQSDVNWPRRRGESPSCLRTTEQLSTFIIVFRESLPAYLRSLGEAHSQLEKSNGLGMINSQC